MRHLLLAVLLAGSAQAGGIIQGGTAGGGGGGTGDAVLSATQTFSGMNTFISTVTVSKTLLIGTTESAGAGLSVNFINGSPAGLAGSVVRISSGAYTGNRGEGMVSILPHETTLQVYFDRAQAQGGGNSNGTVFFMRASSGTLANPLSVGPSGQLFQFSARAHDGTAYRVVGGFTSTVYSSTATGSIPTRWGFSTASFGSVSATEKLRLSSFGGIAINTASEPTAQLDVKMSGDTDSTAYAVKVSSQNGTNLNTITANGINIGALKTKAQIDAITPVTAELGGWVICSDCSAPYAICTATGTTLSGFRRSDSTTIGCGTNN